MQLLPLNSPDLINTAAVWLGEPDNYRWLDFGNGVQRVSAVALTIMAQKDTHVMRVFTAEDGVTPIGLLGLSNLDRNTRVANSWIVLGDRRYGGRGYAMQASRLMLRFAFEEVGLNAVQAWCVECNHASARILQRLNFKPMGRQRRCHFMDGKAHDRLLFDMLLSEYKELKGKEIKDYA